jgi:rare lipoprotein A
MFRPVLAVSLSGLVLLAGCAAPPRSAVGPAAPAQGLYKVGSPYQINGVWYYPGEDLTYNETGIASWYGEDFHGKYTANGEVFDLNALSAAHRTLPMPSIVQVTNLDNGRTLRLRVNDRGPYARGRIIDVSRRASQLLGFEGNGTAKVRVQILAPESIQAKLIAMNASGQSRVAESAPALPIAPVTAEALPTPAGVRVASNSQPPAPRPTPPAPVALPLPSIAPPSLPEKVGAVAVRATGIFIQAGAFSQAENANRLKAKLERLGDVRVTGAHINGANLFRVRIGPVGSVDEADRLLDKVVDSGVPEARIVVD